MGSMSFMKERIFCMKSILVNKKGFLSIYGLLLLQAILAITIIYYAQIQVLQEKHTNYEDIFILLQVRNDLLNINDNQEDIDDQQAKEQKEQEDETFKEDTTTTFKKDYDGATYSFIKTSDYYEVVLKDQHKRMRIHYENDAIIDYEYL